MTNDAKARIDEALSALDVEFERRPDGTFLVTLPGERRLRTVLTISAREHAATLTAFVARRPDEQHEVVYRWLLERNRRMYAFAFCLDPLGDIYLIGRVPLESLTPHELDRLLGSALEYADGAFNAILERGFASSIRREWAWRESRGESTANLAAFARLAEQGDEQGDEQSPDASDKIGP